MQTLRTVSGNVITATVTVVPTGLSSGTDKGTKAKMSSGSVVAIVVAVVVSVVVLLSAVIIGWCCYRRKRRPAYPGGSGDGFPERTTSVLSRAGLLGKRGSGNLVDAYSKDTSPTSTSEKRSSLPLVIDQRLNPNALMVHDDGSRVSFVSMQDNRDYTRTLNVRITFPQPWLLACCSFAKRNNRSATPIRCMPEAYMSTHEHTHTRTHTHTYPHAHTHTHTHTHPLLVFC
jgi:cell wall integrity and stress response component